MLEIFAANTYKHLSPLLQTLRMARVIPADWREREMAEEEDETELRK